MADLPTGNAVIGQSGGPTAVIKQFHPDYDPAEVAKREPSALTRLAELRSSIDNIDAALIHMLAERFRITQAVGAYKAEAGLPASDTAREARQIERLRALAVEADLDPEFSEKFIRFVIDEVIRHHRQHAAGK